MNGDADTLAKRLGKTVHVSPLRHKVGVVRQQYPSPTASCIEEWLVDVANARGARIVVGDTARASAPFEPPPHFALPNEELVVAICQMQNADRPQMLRLAAQLISRRCIEVKNLILVTRRERAGIVLAELARQALRVDPKHDHWQRILAAFQHEKRPTEPLIHWTRIADPIMRNGRCNVAGWRLVA